MWREEKQRRAGKAVLAAATLGLGTSTVAAATRNRKQKGFQVESTHLHGLF